MTIRQFGQSDTTNELDDESLDDVLGGVDRPRHAGGSFSGWEDVPPGFSGWEDVPPGRDRP